MAINTFNVNLYLHIKQLTQNTIKDLDELENVKTFKRLQHTFDLHLLGQTLNWRLFIFSLPEARAHGDSVSLHQQPSPPAHAGIISGYSST